MAKTIVTFFAFLFSTMTHAATPENGWWWNPQESGSGYNIETQNGTLFISTFVYDDSGLPIWYSGSTPIQDAPMTLTLFRSDGGPCLGCGYTPPNTQDSGIQMTLRFESGKRGLVTVNGKSTLIQRFNFAYGNPTEKLLSLWHLSLMSPIVEDGLGVNINVKFNKIEGDFVSGKRGLNSSNIALSGPVSDELYIMFVQISATERLSFSFIFTGLNEIFGRAVFSDTEEDLRVTLERIDQSGFPVIGFRNRVTVNTGRTGQTKAVLSSTPNAVLQNDIAEAKAIYAEGGMARIAEKIRKVR